MSPTAMLALQICVFVTVATLVLVTLRLAQNRLAIQRRLGAEQGSSGLELFRPQEAANPLLQRLSSALLANPKDRTKLHLDLVQAGFISPAASAWYVAIRLSLAIGLPVLLILFNATTNHDQKGLGPLLLPLLVCAFGLTAPRLYVTRRATVRRTKMEHQFPDALDLIMVCVEAGLGLEAAFVRVGRETAESHPEISREFQALAEEMSAGRTRAEALRTMGERLNVESIKAFVALLVQTEALGVSVANALRTYSAEMRETRMLRAEEKAMRIPVLMTIPLVACFMPVMIVALLLPPAIDLVRTLLPTIRGVR